MSFPVNHKNVPSEASGRAGIRQILMPPLLFILLYDLLQTACLLMYRHMKASGPAALSAFLKEKPGLCMAVMAVSSMAAALLPLLGTGRRRLAAFRDPAGGKRAESGSLPVWAGLLSCAVFLCIFSNAQIQALNIVSDSVYSMQPIYRELPFPVILLLFSVFSPFAEEFVFRGIFYTGLRSRFPVPLSVLCSAALFGIYHMEAVQGTYAFFMGILFALAMELTGDLRAPWLLHCISNGLPLILSYLGVWEAFLQRSFRITAFVCFMLSAGVLAAFTARKKVSGGQEL
jgi:membrane protease YdiL (CAAX protease family)